MCTACSIVCLLLPFWGPSEANRHGPQLVCLYKVPLAKVLLLRDKQFRMKSTTSISFTAIKILLVCHTARVVIGCCTDVKRFKLFGVQKGLALAFAYCFGTAFARRCSASPEGLARLLHQVFAVSGSCDGSYHASAAAEAAGCQLPATSLHACVSSCFCSLAGTGPPTCP